MSLPKNFCTAPFIQLQTSKNNSCGPCPYTPNMWNVPGNISDQWKSKEINGLRESFLQDKKDPQCKRCWEEESAGKQSLRLRLLEFKGSANVKKIFEKYIEKKQYENYPKILTIIPGNECNLACATCFGHFSSKWNSLVANGEYTSQKKFTNWNLTSDQYQNIVDNSDKLQRIQLFGGEPFLNKQNAKLLIDKLIQKGTAKNITLYFNTNGTIFDGEYMKRLTDTFKFIEIRQSIDGLFEQFEYLRYGAKFDSVCKNAEKFRALPNTDFEIISTVSNFTIFSLNDINNFFEQKGWPVYFNLAHAPSNYDAYNIPEEVKKHLKLNKKFSDIDDYVKNNRCDENAWKRFVSYTQELDHNRGLSFKNTFPVLYDLVKKYGYE